MAVLGTSRPTILDVARATNPNGTIADVVAVMQQYNDVLDDIPWYEGNLATGNLTTIQTSKASPTKRLLNNGVAPTKSTTGQINDACAIYENRSHVDINVANLNGNLKAFRRTQDLPMIEGFSDAVASDLIYGDSATTPEAFNGFASRYFSLGTTYDTYSQIIDAGGTGSDNTSMWLVLWGPGKVFGVYPKGTQAGLKFEDLGIQEIITSTTTGATLRAYVSWMQWLCGLAVADRRCVVRIANIDVSALLTAGDTSDTSANLLKLMSRAIDLLPPGMSGTPVFYANQTVRSMLRVKMQDKSNLFLTESGLAYGVEGITRRPVLQFQGIPVRRIDGILSTESAITVHSR